MKNLIEYYFSGNIEGKFAICNVSECCMFSTKPNQMLIPAKFCNELNNEIIISKNVFNRLERSNKIVFK